MAPYNMAPLMCLHIDMIAVIGVDVHANMQGVMCADMHRNIALCSTGSLLYAQKDKLWFTSGPNRVYGNVCRRMCQHMYMHASFVDISALKHRTPV